MHPSLHLVTSPERAAQRRDALGGSDLRADRGHAVDALEMGINVVEQDDAADEDGEKEEDDEEEGGELVEVAARPLATTEKKELERTDDPVRMYLREMGSVELARGRDRHRQAHRGRPRGDDRGRARARSPSRPSSSGATS